MKICARLTAMLLFTVCFLSLTTATVQAQVFEPQTQEPKNAEPELNAGDKDSPANKPGGYIRDFFEKRSGERGVAGFITWMLSSQPMIDLFRYFTGRLVNVPNDNSAVGLNFTSYR